MNSGESPKERRGRVPRFKQNLDKIQQSIIAHIKTSPVRESHYGRSGSLRQYLAHDLSIVKMFNLWHKNRTDSKLSIIKYCTYRKIFHEHFNLSFHAPSTDICATCEMFSQQVKGKVNRRENRLQWKLHKARVKQFYRLLKMSKDRCDTLTVDFDVQKNLPLPKTNVSIEYYKCQLWFYNFGIVIHTQDLNPKNVFPYTWMENEREKGSNEICSALANFLQRICLRVIRYGYKRLALFSDSCPGQNKSLSTIALLLTYINSKFNVFKEITWVFPIRGHSFLAPDRVFANVER